MSLSDWVKEDIGDLFDDLADKAVYISQGERKEIEVIAEIGTNSSTKNVHNEDTNYGDCTFTVRDDADLGVKQPAAGDEIEYHGGKFSYAAVEQHSNGVWRLHFTMHESAVKYGSMWK